jgi:hypothetical protein
MIENKIQWALEGKQTCCGCPDPNGHYDTCKEAQHFIWHANKHIIENKYGSSIGININGVVYVDIEWRNQTKY